MQKLKVIIVDDEERARRVLTGLLEKYCKEVEVVAQCSNVSEAVQSIYALKPDAIFLDIEMPRYSGFELLRQLGEFRCDVVFVTAYDQYAIEAFEVSAIDYLLKPVSIEKLEKAVERLRLNQENSQIRERFRTLQENLRDTYGKKIELPVIGGYEYVKQNKISHINADGSYCELFIQGQNRVVVSKKLKFFEELLNDSHSFVRCHRSHIINIHMVTEFHKSTSSVLMEDGSIVSISRDKKALIARMLNSGKA